MVDGDDVVKTQSDRWTRVVRVFAVMVAAQVVVIAVLAYYAHQNRQLADQGRQAKVAVCSYKSDLADRAAATRRQLGQAATYLADHPRGTPVATVVEIQAAIRSDRATLANQRSLLGALAVLRGC